MVLEGMELGFKTYFNASVEVNFIVVRSLLQASRFVERINLDAANRSIEALHCRYDFVFVLVIMIMVTIVIMMILKN